MKSKIIISIVSLCAILLFSGVAMAEEDSGKDIVVRSANVTNIENISHKWRSSDVRAYVVSYENSHAKGKALYMTAVKHIGTCTKLSGKAEGILNALTDSLIHNSPVMIDILISKVCDDDGWCHNKYRITDAKLEEETFDCDPDAETPQEKDFFREFVPTEE